MTCPPEIAAILGQILTTGLLQIRNGSLDPRRMQAEADHLHNLPRLLVEFHPGCLCHYWDVERPSYLQAIDAPNASQVIEELWRQLAPCIRTIRSKMDQAESAEPR